LLILLSCAEGKEKLCERVSEEDTPPPWFWEFASWVIRRCLALKLLHRGSSKPTVVGWGSFSIGDLASCGVFVVVVVG
jgi:hypothetical protein